MTDNTTEAIKKFNIFLKKNNLEEGKHYSANFEFKTLFGKKAITEIKPFIQIDMFERSPLLMFECYDKDGFVGCFNLVEPNLVLDKYDKDAILFEVSENISSNAYDIKIAKNILDKLKLEL